MLAIDFIVHLEPCGASFNKTLMPSVVFQENFALQQFQEYDLVKSPEPTISLLCTLENISLCLQIYITLKYM